MEFVFEIGCEDLPARFVNPLMDQLKTNFVNGCIDRNLLVDPENVYVGGTPRRLLLIVEGLAHKQADVDEERTGPPAAVGFRDGAPTKAAEGFARGQGVAVEDLYVVETEKGEYVAAKVFEEGAPTADILPDILDDVLKGFSFPKSMRWGANRVAFARPVRWLLALLDGNVVPVELAGVKSGNTTLGHRFAPAPGHQHAPSELEITDSNDYLEKLRSNGLIVDFADRRAKVAELVDSTAADAGTPVDDPGLIDEVTNLVESPHAVLVRYDEAYLDLPDEVLLSSMRKHQRYFGIRDGDNLTNACVVVYNTPVRDPQVVAAGNLRVLKARLDDAKFFWEQDLKHDLEDRLDRLESVLWLKQLGSMRQKSDRIAMLAERLADTLGFDDATQTAAARAGQLCKCDLVTQMVDEFPDLQGVVGGYYAARSGEDETVATAISEHYRPQGADDALPTTDAASTVALAEKLDSLVGCFLIDMVPTSTADPYGLRRAAIGTIRILQHNGWTVSLADLVDEAAGVYADRDVDAEWTDARRAALLDFLAGRLQNQLTTEHPTDIVRAVLAVGLEDVTTVVDRVEALSDLRTNPVFEPLAAGFKRVVNILRKQATEYDADELTVNPDLFEHDEERALWTAASEASAQMETAIDDRNWTEAVKLLAGLREPVDNFFDGVMVMAEDPEQKRNRLALLFELETLFKRVADLSVVS